VSSVKAPPACAITAAPEKSPVEGQAPWTVISVIA